MSGLILRWTLLPVLCVTSGCYSLSRIRLSEIIKTDGEAVVLWIWIDAPGPRLSDGDYPVSDAVSALVLYPLDLVMSASIAVRAPFDPELDIRWGPIGALAGVALPWVTLIPYIYPPYGVLNPLPEVAIDRSAFDDLVARIKAGDGTRAYREIVAEYRWVGGESVLISVELSSDTAIPAAEQDAAAAAHQAARR